MCHEYRFYRITEHPELEGTHKRRRVQFLARHRTIPTSHPMTPTTSANKSRLYVAPNKTSHPHFHLPSHETYLRKPFFVTSETACWQLVVVVMEMLYLNSYGNKFQPRAWFGSSPVLAVLEQLWKHWMDHPGPKRLRVQLRAVLSGVSRGRISWGAQQIAQISSAGDTGPGGRCHIPVEPLIAPDTTLPPGAAAVAGTPRPARQPRAPTPSSLLQQQLGFVLISSVLEG